MKTRSLILSPHEVLSALRGELGLIVRPVKGQPTTALMGHEGEIWHRVGEGKYQSGLPVVCPLGVPGDRLVGKETWHTDESDLGRARAEHEDAMSASPIFYRADFANKYAGCRWRFPATMPAWASRITLEVESVRCCRLLQLCEDDARKMGVPWKTYPDLPTPRNASKAIRTSFESTWNRHYGRRYPWESNPWVWAAKVKRA